LEPATDDLVHTLTDRYCLLCFGLDPEDEYMWQEYGEGAKGICFGFDIRKSILSQVEYVPEMKIAEIPPELVKKLIAEHRPYVNRKPTPTEKRGMDYIRPILLTKFNTWEREREWRAFLRRDEEEDDHYYAKLSTRGVYLREVVLGRDCEHSEDEVQELVRDYPRRPITVRKQRQIKDEEVEHAEFA
jgi:hypothetical protein